jgi:hypothetical protein
MAVLFLSRLSLQGGGLYDVSLDEPKGGLRFPSVYSEVIWESRYVSEGRDYLEGGGSITNVIKLRDGFISHVKFSWSPSFSTRARSARTDDGGTFD